LYVDTFPAFAAAETVPKMFANALRSVLQPTGQKVGRIAAGAGMVLSASSVAFCADTKAKGAAAAPAEGARCRPVVRE
jgi:hypothetical protein